MNKLLKNIIIDKIEYNCWFTGYNVDCKERYEYITSNGVHAYFTRL